MRDNCPQGTLVQRIGPSANRAWMAAEFDDDDIVVGEDIQHLAIRAERGK